MNVFVTDLNVPKRYRNGRIYGGNSFKSTNIYNTTSDSGIHIETDTLTDLTEREINIEFATPFEIRPKFIALKVYRMTDNGGGRWVVEDVIHYHSSENWLTTDGFNIVIDSDENLTGVIIEYLFI